jgi:hypothetical protein
MFCPHTRRIGTSIDPVVPCFRSSAKARRVGAPDIPARKICCPEHVPFLTSTMAYEKYLEYWNCKLKEMRRAAERSLSRRG